MKDLGHENDWGSLEIPPEDYDDALSAAYAVDFLKQQQNASLFLGLRLVPAPSPLVCPAAVF